MRTAIGAVFTLAVVAVILFVITSQDRPQTQGGTAPTGQQGGAVVDIDGQDPAPQVDVEIEDGPPETGEAAR